MLKKFLHTSKLSIKPTKGAILPLFCHFGTYYLNNYRVYSAQNILRSLPMPTAIKLPMKFHCEACNTVYLQKYAGDMLHSYPNCPNCKQPGQLQGTIETQDFLKHPVAVGKCYFENTLQRFQQFTR